MNTKEVTFWNYRVVEFVDKSSEERTHQVCEIHYTSDSDYSNAVPYAFTEATIQWDPEDQSYANQSPEDIIAMMKAALYRPILKRTDFPEGGKVDKQ